VAHNGSPQNRAYIGLGSNLADPQAQIMRALGALDRLPGTRVVARSGLYVSRPLADLPQPDYLNAVATVDTALAPHRLLHEMQRIEREQGRVPGGERWAARTIDLDLLIYGQSVIRSASLSVPHPGLSQRDFVLQPLAELAPGLDVPSLGKVHSLLESCPRRGLRRFEASR
jgi:2-amino-4-hydroxy-6-hydroxymethyldihydropteridine diphosphokinase